VELPDVVTVVMNDLKREQRDDHDQHDVERVHVISLRSGQRDEVVAEMGGAEQHVPDVRSVPESAIVDDGRQVAVVRVREHEPEPEHEKNLPS
jgi:hypothetical protein